MGQGGRDGEADCTMETKGKRFSQTSRLPPVGPHLTLTPPSPPQDCYWNEMIGIVALIKNV